LLHSKDAEALDVAKQHQLFAREQGMMAK
jgi:hypothetical protein